MRCECGGWITAEIMTESGVRRIGLVCSVCGPILELRRIEESGEEGE